MRSMGWVLWSVVLLAMGTTSAATATPHSDTVAVTDPVEREFERKLHAVRERQREETREIQQLKDISPQERLDRRQKLFARHQSEIQALENEYKEKITPEARERWEERKASREKKFQTLQQKTKSKGAKNKDGQKSTK